MPLMSKDSMLSTAINVSKIEIQIWLALLAICWNKPCRKWDKHRFFRSTREGKQGESGACIL